MNGVPYWKLKLVHKLLLFHLMIRWMHSAVNFFLSAVIFALSFIVLLILQFFKNKLLILHTYAIS